MVENDNLVGTRVTNPVCSGTEGQSDTDGLEPVDFCKSPVDLVCWWVEPSARFCEHYKIESAEQKSGLLQLSGRESLILGFCECESNSCPEITVCFATGEWSQNQN